MKRLFKRMTAMLLAAALFCTCIPAGTALAATYTSFYAGENLVITTSGGVRLHKAPSVSADAYLTVPYGGRVTVDYIYYEGKFKGWMQVTYGEYIGYMDGNYSYFAEYTGYNSPTITSCNKECKVIAKSGLTVHSSPVKLSSNVQDYLGYGWTVQVTGYTNTGWSRVKYYTNSVYNTKTGYVYSSYLQECTASASTPTYTETFTTVYGWSAKVKASLNSGVNVHASPSVSANVLTDVYPGEMLNILAESTSWFRVSINDDGNMTTGYILRSYCIKKDAMVNLYLSKTKKTMTKGTTCHLKVRGNTTGMQLTTTWSSSKKKVAKVNQFGVVTARKKGTATIKCKVKLGNRTKTLKCKITVKAS